ncbi:uncharacterized protein LOC108600255 [Drosophila busckii]|nr:uncharacterized protein LOC108600255 [Drosophila busckii]
MTTYCLLCLALVLTGAVEAASSPDNSKLLTVLNSSLPTVELLLHIGVVAAESAPLSTTVSPRSLESIIRAEVNGSWERGRLVLQLASQARTLELKHAIYEALWQELQQTKQIYDPFKLMDFYEELARLGNVPATLMMEVYQVFVSRSAQLLSAPFHTPTRNARFPLLVAFFQRLTLSTLDYLRDILNALYDAVLTLESTLSVVQRLGNFSGASLTQLTVANLQLSQREELKSDNAAVQAALESNLRQLLEQPNFQQDVEHSWRQQLYTKLPNDERLLYTAQKVCLRNVTNDNAYIYECPQTYLICTNARDPKKAAYYVQRGHGRNNNVQFAFYSSYWRNRYILHEPSNQTAPNAIKKNIYSRDAIDWWYVVPVAGGVALYDNSSLYLLCGGDTQHWDGEEKHVYSRNAADLYTHRNECVWSIEDCSDVA